LFAQTQTLRFHVGAILLLKHDIVLGAQDAATESKRLEERLLARHYDWMKDVFT
jgi:hypothetical protein